MIIAVINIIFIVIVVFTIMIGVNFGKYSYKLTVEILPLVEKLIVFATKVKILTQIWLTAYLLGTG